MDKKAMQDFYLDVIREEGYKGEVDNDGDIHFKFEGMSYFIMVREDDETYYSILFPRFWNLESQDEKMKALIVCNSLNSQYKCGKLFAVGELESVSASIQLFLNDINDFKKFFSRILGILKGMVDEFVVEMKKG